MIHLDDLLGFLILIMTILILIIFVVVTGSNPYLANQAETDFNTKIETIEKSNLPKNEVIKEILNIDNIEKKFAFVSVKYDNIAIKTIIEDENEDFYTFSYKDVDGKIKEKTIIVQH